MSLFNDTFTTLEHSLNYASAKNRAISSNIANVDTPGYKAKKVVFSEVLKNEVFSISTKRTSERHMDFHPMSQRSFKTVTNSNTTYNHNGNNVDIDKEMSELAKNQIYYQALSDRMSRKFRSLEAVIKGGN
ncbi:flagellar basal body rod protein FlgB [Halobacillus sp. BBL2006]|uniref:flagellar basal body rod protein FlgB n=1 Tax=Halobacillus sp. BBL2006 TaxID=1543706 RepID=UPI0005437024|nr:flagellar basal body rod protein FlgB [Halobacillus sp. BBL2006]KHE72733.1 flagellar basal body rod protein FlgB [Halobacillus sp. BBL2006]